jgi:hypothetical protein
MVETQMKPGMPDMTLGGEMVDDTEFLGVIVTDAWTEGKVFEEGKPAKWQWHLAVKPTDIPIQGETGAFHTYYNYTTRANSALGAARKAMTELFPETMKIGAGELIGQAAWWVRRDIEFGMNRSGEMLKAEQVLIPVRAASEADAKRATAHSQPGATPAGVASAPAEATVDLEELDDETVDKVIAFVTGKNARELQFAVARNKDLSREIKQGLLSGELIDALTEAGALETNGEGKYQAVA